MVTHLLLTTLFVWWYFLIQITVLEFDGQKDFHPMDAYGSHVLQHTPYCSCGVQKTLRSNLTQNGDLSTMFLAKIKSSQTLLSPIAEIPSQSGKQEKHNLDKQTLIQMNNAIK